jgi:hypothetical protein
MEKQAKENKETTMIINVYHAKNPTFFEDDKIDGLHHVAEVTALTLDQAYEKTNTIDLKWWKNQGVKFLGSPDYGTEGCRSTSVGDVMEMDGQFYQVASVGFRKIARPEGV